MDRTFFAFFKASGIGVTGLVVTFDGFKKLKVAPYTLSALVAGGACVDEGAALALAAGFYTYSATGLDFRTYDYFGRLKTGGTADDKQLPALWSEFSPAAEVALPNVPSGGDGSLPVTGIGANKINLDNLGGIMRVVDVAGSVAGNVSGKVIGGGDSVFVGVGVQIAGAGGIGSGDVPVDHNGGPGVTVNGVAASPDCMLVESAGITQDDVEIIAFTAADYDAGRTDATYRQGTTRSADDGRWATPIMLSAGRSYRIVFNGQGFESLVVAVDIA